MSGWRGTTGRRGAWVAAGICLWIAIAFLLRDPQALQRLGRGALATTDDAEMLASMTVGEDVRLAWQSTGCEVQAVDGGTNGAGDGAGAVEDSGIDVLGAATRSGWQRAVRAFACREGGAPFYVARAIRASDGPARDRATVAEVHVDGRAFALLLERALPSLIQRALAPEIARAGAALQAASRGWRVPPQLLDEVRVGDATRFTVSGVRVRLRDQSVVVSLSLDAAVVLELHARRVFRPKARGSRVTTVRIHERFSPVVATFRLGEWPAVSLASLSLERDGCTVSDVPVLSRFVSLDRLCNDLLRDLEPRIERELRAQIGGYLEDVGQSVDVDGLVRERLTSAFAGWGLPERAQAWWEDAAIGIGAVTQDASGLHIVLTSGAPWAAYAPAAGLSVPNTASDVDVAVAAVAVQSLLTAMAEHPLEQLWSAAQTLDAPVLRAPLARLSEAMDAAGFAARSGDASSTSLDMSFAILGLETNATAVVRPRVWIEGPQQLGVMLSDFEGLRVKSGRAGLRFQLWASVQWSTDAEGLHTRVVFGDAHDGRGDPGGGARMVPVAVDTYGLAALSAGERRRLAAQVEIVRDILARPSLAEAMTAVSLPPLSLAADAPWLGSLRADEARQAFYVGVRLDDVVAPKGR